MAISCAFSKYLKEKAEQVMVSHILPLLCFIKALFKKTKMQISDGHILVIGRVLNIFHLKLESDGIYKHCEFSKL